MNRRILLQVAGPAVFVGLVLFLFCLLGAWQVNRLQTKFTHILASNVVSMEAAQQLETNVRFLRYHSFLYLLRPEPALERDVQHDQEMIEEWLDRAEKVATTQKEYKAIAAFKQGYKKFQSELETLRKEVQKVGKRWDFQKLEKAHPIRHIVEPCQEYARVNEEMMIAATEESVRVSRWLQGTMLLLGIGGPISGLVSGFGIARGLSRSLYRLSVRVQDMAQHLEQDVASVKLNPQGDIERLDHQLEHVMGRVAEVTERLQRQQREMLRAQQLSAVGQLAASVAHEVRNPLTSIKMLVEAGLRPHKPRPLTQENLEVIHAEIKRLERSVQDFLDFARPPALRKETCDLRQVVHQAVDLVRARARQQGVEIEAALPGTPVLSEVDRSQLCTVFVNLFINALDVMPTGGALHLELDAADPERCCFTVRDTGPGIPADMAERIFTPFASSKATGSGLGLSICKRIAEEHGGAIAASTPPEGGACFTVVLPHKANEYEHAEIAGRR